MVYFFQQPVPNGHGWTPDLSPAAPFGMFEFVFSSTDRPCQNPLEARLKADNALRDFNPEKDYICWSNAGDVFCIYAAVASLTQRGIRSVKALVWHKPRNHDEQGRYVPTEVPLWHFE